MSHIVRHKKEHNRGYEPGHSAIGNNSAIGNKGGLVSIRLGAKAKQREAERIAFVGDMVDAWETAVKLGDVAGQYGVIMSLALAGAVGLACTYERSMG